MMRKWLSHEIPAVRYEQCSQDVQCIGAIYKLLLTTDHSLSWLFDLTSQEVGFGFGGIISSFSFVFSSHSWFRVLFSDFFGSSGDLYEYTPFFCIQLYFQNSEKRLETVVIYFPRNRSVHIWPILRKIVKRSYLWITLTKKFTYLRKWRSNFN